MVTNDNCIFPMRATHPGSVLRKELKARGIKEKEFADTIGIPVTNLSELINCKRDITKTIALKLEETLGIPFKNWMNLQTRYYYVLKCRAEIDAKEGKAAIKEEFMHTDILPVGGRAGNGLLDHRWSGVIG